MSSISVRFSLRKGRVTEILPEEFEERKTSQRTEYMCKKGFINWVRKETKTTNWMAK